MWQYNSFYDDPNNVLIHSSSHKYIDKSYQNGRWVYTYPDDGKDGIIRKDISSNSYSKKKATKSFELDSKAVEKVLSGTRLKGRRRIGESKPSPSEPLEKEQNKGSLLERAGEAIKQGVKNHLNTAQEDAKSFRDAYVKALKEDDLDSFADTYKAYLKKYGKNVAERQLWLGYNEFLGKKLI